MKIVFTKHAAIDKFAMLKKHKFKIRVTKRLIREIIRNPDHEERTYGPPQFIASKTIDSRHVLRIVYRQEDDIILVITYYPAEKGRYYEDKN